MPTPVLTSALFERFESMKDLDALLQEIGQMYKFDVTNNSWGWTSKWADPLFTSTGATEWAAYKLAADSGAPAAPLPGLTLREGLASSAFYKLMIAGGVVAGTIKPTQKV